jgi:starvation-inducible outer membrane lipoprotein
MKKFLFLSTLAFCLTACTPQQGMQAEAETKTNSYITYDLSDAVAAGDLDVGEVPTNAD